MTDSEIDFIVEKHLTHIGYIKRTPEEVREAIIKKLKIMNPNFTKLELDVQANLIDTAVSKILQYENILDVMFNAYSMDGSNNFFFKQMGEELGLRMKNAYNSQVVLTFGGLPGDIIPPHTKVRDKDNQYVFETLERKVIGTTESVDVIAYGEADTIAPIGALNVLVSILSDGITVTNKQTSMAKIESESFEEYKLRAQARLRSPRLGGRLYAESCLKSIDGVDSRLIAFYAREYTKKYDPDNPELDEDDEGEDDTPPKVEEEGTLVSQAIIDTILLVNAGESAASIKTLQDYVTSKYSQGVTIKDKEFVHLYNKAGINNYLYYNTHWYEVYFTKSDSSDKIEGFGISKNILAESFEDISADSTGEIVYCNRPGDKIGFYENKTSKYNVFFGKRQEISETGKPIVNNFMKLLGIEAIVGGGDDYEVALALYQSFFETQKLLSYPSNDEKDRTKSIKLGLYNNTFPIRFTRPKLLQLNLKLSMGLLNKTMSATAIQVACSPYLEKAINALKVGTPIVANQLNQIIQPGLADIDIKPEEIKVFTWQYALGKYKDSTDADAKPEELAVWKAFDLDNKIEEIYEDCYCILVRFECQVIG